MRYLVVILALSAALFGAEVVAGNSQIVFQGTISRPDGSPFFGQAVVGIRFFDENRDSEVPDVEAAGPGIIRQRTQTVVVANGSYSVVVTLDATEMDEIATRSNCYLEVFVKDISTTTNTGHDDIFSSDYRMTPRVQMLSAPVALTARGIYMNLDNDARTWRVGESMSKNNTVISDGMIVGRKVGIGTNAPDAMLHVVNDPGSKAMHVGGNLIGGSGTVISANAVWHARWQ